MTPSMTACPPTSVSSPLSRIGSIWTWAKRRKKVRRDKLKGTSDTFIIRAPGALAGWQPAADDQAAPTLPARNTHHVARPQVRHGYEQQQDQPEHARPHDHLCQPRTVLDVHKEEDDQRSFHDCNSQRHEDIPAPEVDRRNIGG